MIYGDEGMRKVSSIFKRHEKTGLAILNHFNQFGFSFCYTLCTLIDKTTTMTQFASILLFLEEVISSLVLIGIVPHCAHVGERVERKVSFSFQQDQFHF